MIDKTIKVDIAARSQKVWINCPDFRLLSELGKNKILELLHSNSYDVEFATFNITNQLVVEFNEENTSENEIKLAVARQVKGLLFNHWKEEPLP